MKARQAQEFEAFHEHLHKASGHSYKFSRELLQMRKSIETLARQGDYGKAHAIKTKAEQLERWERVKLDNEQRMHIATKELQLRQQQQLQLEALRRRIQRGREEHKEHWLLGAQRLMQSHRNMLADLRAKHNLVRLRAGRGPTNLGNASRRCSPAIYLGDSSRQENVRADVSVKLDVAASRAAANSTADGRVKGPASAYANAKPRIDSRRPRARPALPAA